MNWKVAYAPNFECKDKEYKTITAIENSKMPKIEATVPGNFELDLMREGIIPDLYFSTNTLEAQKFENLHCWYYTTVYIEDTNSYIEFEGIDTVADIYVNGVFVKSVDNMFISHRVYPEFHKGTNEIVVHIKPVTIEARKYRVPAGSNMLNYNYAGAYMRKPAHSFGWDIMPRIVTSGLWKDVKIKPIKADEIVEVYLATCGINDNNASMNIYVCTEMSNDFAQDYTYKVQGVCKESSFMVEDGFFHTSAQKQFEIENCKLWWPKPMGEPNLYDVRVTLYYKGKEVDTYSFKVGIRIVELDMTPATDKNGNGKFGFIINGKPVFVLGTNWVPLDAFHSRDKERLPKALEMLDDIGCNMVRCWGGNLYESHEFFDFCDSHGIMVWQDFSMGCGAYPLDEVFAEKLREEATVEVKRLRNHASLVLWAGDNECDIAYSWIGMRRDPNINYLTREVMKRVVASHDYSRLYLPSSPYVSEESYNSGDDVLPENHLWGPRDYFKGEFYRDTFCHFASETGYHGFNSPDSLRKFLKAPEVIFNEDGTPTSEYLVHASCMQDNMNDPYSYRIKLAYDQVVTLFGKAEEKFEDFVKQSQISQAEAKKYFIEKFRIGKGKRTGIIWWNLVDGWPQVSDAIVDYYYTKKLAYSYIKRSQEPVCIMIDEPQDGKSSIVGVNDFTRDVHVKYKVTNIDTDIIVSKGDVVIDALGKAEFGNIVIPDNEKNFYLIEWELDGKKYKNHYFSNIIDIDYNQYMEDIKKCGMDEFEGFGI